MNISEMIEKLQALKDKHGDLPILMIDSIGLTFKVAIDHAKLYTGEEFISIGKEMDERQKILRPYVYNLK